uniref:Smad nuclear interacting protein n=1 Tax=Rhizophora mucronata TaxID=61149 RepID=A0A2P2KWR9_RHIMU
MQLLKSPRPPSPKRPLSRPLCLHLLKNSIGGSFFLYRCRAAKMATMGPPLSRNPNAGTATIIATTVTTEPETKPKLVEEPQLSSSSGTAIVETLMGPPPPRQNLDSLEPGSVELSAEQGNSQSDANMSNSGATAAAPADQSVKQRSSVPYTIPEWSGPPLHQYYLEILKDGSIIDQLDVCEKGAYMFGRVDLCDFVLEHPSISRFHAVLQFKRHGDAYLYDLGSTHGTFINKHQVDRRVHVELHVGDVIQFGHSSRLYIFQGPPDLMPPEIDLKILRDAKIRQELIDREASLQRAKVEASLADGVSWGMGEDAIEEDQDEVEEVTWQTYKGQLTEKQEKTHEKIIKRTEKIAHMKKEIDSIRAKEISQGGLTQGQQTQIARNDQRITQITEELENLEDTLNESIQESIGARAGRRSRSKGRETMDDDEDFLSDDDDFYDRTKKPLIKKAGENQSVETADTLLGKRDAIMKEMEDKKELLQIEKNKMAPEAEVDIEAGDSLDAYMSGLSTQLVHDKTSQIEKELSSLRTELDRIFFLLKIADPSGEASRQRDLKQEQKLDKAETLAAATEKQPTVEPKKICESRKPINVSRQKAESSDASINTTESKSKPETDKLNGEAPASKAAVYTAVKPQWLGAVEDREVKEAPQQEISNVNESDKFVDYKDRQKILNDVDGAHVKMDSEIESASPGLIIRKRKEINRPGASNNGAPTESTSSMGLEFSAEDAIALLLKHERGYHAESGEVMLENPEALSRSQSNKDKKKPKRILGPNKPEFLNSSPDYDAWVPPEGKSSLTLNL